MSGLTGLQAIVPMKPICLGKTRLAEALDVESRAALSLLLLQHVLRVLARTSTRIETWVVGGDQWVQALATQESAKWKDDPGGGLNQVVRISSEEAFQQGAPAVLVLPGDLGLLNPQDVEQLVTISCGLRRVVLARAATDGGTNAILVPRGLLVGPCFGPDSFARHLEAAREVNIPVKVAASPGLSFDLDTPQDLMVYRQQRPGLDGELMSWRARLEASSPAAIHTR